MIAKDFFLTVLNFWGKFPLVTHSVIQYAKVSMETSLKHFQWNTETWITSIPTHWKLVLVETTKYQWRVFLKQFSGADSGLPPIYMTETKLFLAHPTGRALTSDWSINSSVMVVYEKIFLNFQNFLFKVQVNLCLIDSQDK